MRSLAKGLGRFGAWTALAVTIFIVGFEISVKSNEDWGATTLVSLVLVGSALLGGWGAARAPWRPILAGFLLWLSCVLYGYLALLYKNSVPSVGPIRGIVLLPPMAFFWSGLFAFIGKFTQASPAMKT